ncbi:hypothetical protein HUT03_00175 [Candidatus Liberibacter africanus]|uniref:Uncharacterized protein n=1 Tax=Candidatus Liberibacter africanus PTSAPSY TaxID=1277257 RepID=A0A0G3I387_LIBAF|nr:hypothetical protein [Candidatus Liberibacter africanus]AKK19695.1 hypothetical protein G293_00175 [Candidatus Liberibacter africanus PTSAPSY]QTP63581.1 hypothetical protein HUT03_00175 [Candidatus Liberibacter africanus]
MNILTILNTICDLIGLSKFEKIYQNQDENTALLVSLLQQSGEEICLKVDWPHLLREVKIQNFPYPLPQDYQRPLLGSAIIMPDLSLGRPVMNIADWEVVKNFSNIPWYWIDRQKIHFSFNSPVTFRYFSKHWIIGRNKEEKNSITTDDDSTLLPAYLLIKDVVWRWRRAQGLSFADYLREFDSALAMEKILGG